ncbi:MAG: DUF2817 domain-containing protein [Isosphaeraceae bacterium]|nr:DUF2817 domain-containing protein [Isosphaeraceae bacterium]
MTGTVSIGIEAFSPDYFTARERFRAAVEARGFVVESLSVGLRGPSGEDLTIDVARLGSERPERAVVVSSGLHGVEGFFGSAVQLALLEAGVPGDLLADGDSLILVHALDPYGFAWIRRFDEQNVDLNRNFLINGERYQGSPPAYRQLNGLLNPPYAPSRVDTFWPRALLALAWYGRRSLRQAVAHGQYDFPRGLFFGGVGHSRTYQLLLENLPRWLGSAQEVTHIDFHTGLGEWGTYKLLIDPELGPASFARLVETFGEDAIQVSSSTGISYTTRGDLGPWCQATFPECHYDYVCAEFGTYSPLTVVSALRWENQAHHWGDPGDAATHNAKAWLKEVFVPADTDWRATTLAEGVALVRRALASLRGRSDPVRERS